MNYKQNKSSNPQGRCWIDYPDAGNSSSSNPLSCISHSWKKEQELAAVWVHSLPLAQEWDATEIYVR